MDVMKSGKVYMKTKTLKITHIHTQLPKKEKNAHTPNHMTIYTISFNLQSCILRIFVESEPSHSSEHRAGGGGGGEGCLLRK